MHNIKNINIATYSKDLLDICSKHIIETHSNLLPDLRRITIFIPSNLVQPKLQNKLLAHALRFGHSAVFLPCITPLRQWALTKYTPNKPLLSRYARELLLVDAINQQPSLFVNSNSWAIANELFTFFDEMSLNNIDLPSVNNYFSENEKVLNTSHVLSYESKLVKTLWHAWKEQLSQEGLFDPVDAYLETIRNIVLKHDDIYYSIGLDKLSVNEKIFFEKINDQSTLHFFTYGSNSNLNTMPDTAIRNVADRDSTRDTSTDTVTSAYSMFFDSVFTSSELSIKERADIFSKACPISPINKQFRIFDTNSLELHAKALDIKIRDCIHQGKNNIGIVTADRKLARRLRAVLEHANVVVNDLGGWALATTSAATTIEFLLQIIEENFPSKQFIALAKSPFFPRGIQKEVHDEAINFLEKEIVLKFNVLNGLQPMRVILDQYHEKHETDETQVFEYLYQLFDKFESTTLSLFKLFKQKSAPLHRFFVELLNNLKAFGIYAVLNKDDAGRQIIELFETQISHFENIGNELDWAEWRHFLARILDQQNYKPPIVKSNVTFCSLEQSRLLDFDALIIASVDKDSFPGSPSNYIFFNESIRSELKIPTWRDEHTVQFYLFRMLIEAAPDVLVTVQSEQNGEKIKLSPWLEAIVTFHQMAYGTGLEDEELHALTMLEEACIVRDSHLPKPVPTQQPAPILDASLIPDTLSISQYQQLMSCPYQFYASACLKLSKTEELKEDIDKADFGSLVHKCIYAFFIQFPDAPSPFDKKITEDNRKDAETVLNSISEYIFNKYTDGNFYGTLWLQRWLNLIPSFISWELQRQEKYNIYKHEASLQKTIKTCVTLKGRVDRIDQSTDGYAIIDYKTGQISSRKDVLAGEQVQLPMYAFLQENCNQVEYVSIGKNDRIRSEVIIKNNELEDLIHKQSKRLNEFVDAINNQVQLTALADDDVCDRCEIRGLCRKGFWKT